ncbi:tetratricopeptide repeat protein [Photobacterium nomapromontoriensis]|uniref:tetratricopeptide repeat protein n=1 Tax=Photobacterium nomapromontoriensis TaxID=2910237 RepID=UPI003D111796
MISKLKAWGVTAIGTAVFFVISAWFESDGIHLSGIEHYAEQVSPQEAKQLGFILFKSKRYSEARTFFEPAAKHGDIPSQVTLATLYYYDKNTPQHFKLAYQWFIKNSDNALAQYYISLMYYFGDYLVRNPEKAQFWLQKAANQSLPVAQYNLAVGYYNQRQYLEAYVWASYARSNDFFKGNKLVKDAADNLSPQDKVLAQQRFNTSKADHVWQSEHDSGFSALFRQVF